MRYSIQNRRKLRAFGTTPPPVEAARLRRPTEEPPSGPPTGQTTSAHIEADAPPLPET